MKRCDIGPFAMVAESVYAMEDLSDSACRVYLVLAKAANDESKCWPSNKAIGEKSGGKKESAVRAALTELEARGLIKVKKRFGEGGRQLSNEYFVVRAPKVNPPSEIRTPRKSEPYDIPNPPKNGTLQDSAPSPPLDSAPKLEPEIPDQEKNLPSVGKKKNGFVHPTEEECREYASSIKLPKSEGSAFRDYFLEVGWLVGKKKAPMKDWEAALRTWKRNFVKGGGELVSPAVVMAEPKPVIGNPTTTPIEPDPTDKATIDGLRKEARQRLRIDEPEPHPEDRRRFFRPDPKPRKKA